MPRYFFHVVDRSGSIEDDEGQELADREDARIQAIQGARSIMAAAVLDGELDLSGVVTIADETGASFEVRYAEVVGSWAKLPRPSGSTKPLGGEGHAAEDRLAMIDRLIRECEQRLFRQRQLFASISSAHHREISEQLLEQLETSLSFLQESRKNSETFLEQFEASVVYWRKYRKLVSSARRE